MPDFTVNLVRENLKQIENEPWKTDHAQAMRCREFEEWLKLCIETFERINRLDEGYRSSVYDKDVEYDAAWDETVLDLYRQWRHRVSGFPQVMEDLAKKYEHIEYSDEFLRCLLEVDGILTPDGEFFADGRLTELRERAIRETREGKVRGWPSE